MTKTRKYVFWYHFNKPAWLRRKVISWSIHWRNKCYIVDTIICKVPTASAIRKRQPVAVIKGRATNLEIREEDDKVIGIIT